MKLLTVKIAAPERDEILQPFQCRMARAGLGITVRQLAAILKINAGTICNFEMSDTKPMPRGTQPRIIRAIRLGLEYAGATFLDENATQGAGVAIKERS